MRIIINEPNGSIVNDNERVDVCAFVLCDACTFHRSFVLVSSGI